MKVNKYLVLHSGDKILMSHGCTVLDLKASEKYLNDNLEDQLRLYVKDIQETASHIELILSHKDKLK